MSVYSLGPFNPYGQNVVGYFNELTMKARKKLVYTSHRQPAASVPASFVLLVALARC